MTIREVRLNGTTILYDDELYFTDEHVWVRIEGENRIRIGFSDFGQKIAGKVLAVRIRPPGTRVEAKKGVATMETGKWVGMIRTPVAGKIVEVNDEVIKNPSLINSDPYGRGWIAVLEVEDVTPIKSLHHGEEVESWIKEEAVKYRLAPK